MSPLNTSAVAFLSLVLAVPVRPAQSSSGEAPTFHSDILPILQKHCQGCHKPGEIGPMPLVSYQDVKPWAAAAAEAARLRKMPPWFADSAYGKFANDPRLSEQEIGVIQAWANSGAPEGPPKTQLRSVKEHRSSEMPADVVIEVPSAIQIPANEVIEYQHVVLPLPFRYDRWVRGIEIRPSDRSVVHHAVLYVREPNSTWLREAKPGVPYAPGKADGEMFRRSRDTKEDILAIYAPGASATVFPEGMAKKIVAGSDLVLQMHYTSRNVTTSDTPKVRLLLSTEPPKKRILTLQMGRDDLRISPGEEDYRASVSGTLPQDALLVSMYPHMHLRGTAFDFEIVGPGGYVEPLLKVKNYDFHWQLQYILQTPRLLRKGTTLRWTGYFDNSAKNHHNPDPAKEATWGEQSWDEMMIGFFDVAVDPGISKQDFFVR